MIVFVYGSLKSGECNHRRLARARFLRVARTNPCFSLFDLGPFPAMTRGGNTSVEGELYDVDDETLAALDRFEGCPTLYERIEVPLLGGGRAAGYVYRAGRLGNAVAVPNGRWLGVR